MLFDFFVFGRFFFLSYFLLVSCATAVKGRKSAPKLAMKTNLRIYHRNQCAHARSPTPKQRSNHYHFRLNVGVFAQLLQENYSELHFMMSSCVINSGDPFADFATAKLTIFMLIRAFLNIFAKFSEFRSIKKFLPFSSTSFSFIQMRGREKE